MWNFPLRPEAASEHAQRYDALFFTITALSIFFTIVVGIMVLVLAVRYRRGSKVDRRNPLEHHTGLEMTWLFVPLILGLGIFTWSAINYVQVRKPKENAMELFVIGKQWMWHVQHMNGIRENNEMHIPVDTPIRLTMISQDVIHAMYLPEFRAQYHVVPGRYTELHFTPIKEGKYKMLCAMHCGTQHSEMVGYVYVLSKQAYAQWLENQGNRYRPVATDMVEAGRQVWTEKACSNCHGGVDTMRGPTLQGILGLKREFTDGTSTVANEDYLRESILDPYIRITRGYEQTMPAYRGQLTEEQVLQLITYLKSLSNPSPGGPKMPYERPQPQTTRSTTSPENATDIANKRASAGATQAEEMESRR